MTTLARRQHFGFDVPELWRRMFETDLEAGGWLRVEQYREGDSFVVRSEMPGIDPDKDVDIELTDGVLRISARREERTENKDENTFRSEFRYGTFVRNVVLPPGVEEKDIKASYQDGILEVRIPIPKEQQKQGPKKIRVDKR
jgi:HSP20 family protein